MAGAAGTKAPPTNAVYCSEERQAALRRAWQAPFGSVGVSQKVEASRQGDGRSQQRSRAAEVSGEAPGGVGTWRHARRARRPRGGRARGFVWAQSAVAAFFRQCRCWSSRQALAPRRGSTRCSGCWRLAPSARVLLREESCLPSARASGASACTAERLRGYWPLPAGTRDLPAERASKRSSCRWCRRGRALRAALNA
jgi:hypothetical protein